MTKERLAEAIQIVKDSWEEQGECLSCGYKGSLDQYDLEKEITLNFQTARILLPCKNKEAKDAQTHRGVHILV